VTTNLRHQNIDEANATVANVKSSSSDNTMISDEEEDLQERKTTQEFQDSPGKGSSSSQKKIETSILASTAFSSSFSSSTGTRDMFRSHSISPEDERRRDINAEKSESEFFSANISEEDSSIDQAWDSPGSKNDVSFKTREETTAIPANAAVVVLREIIQRLTSARLLMKSQPAAAAEAFIAVSILKFFIYIIFQNMRKLSCL
jgi:hypothetical protein